MRQSSRRTWTIVQHFTLSSKQRSIPVIFSMLAHECHNQLFIRILQAQQRRLLYSDTENVRSAVDQTRAMRSFSKDRWQRLRWIWNWTFIEIIQQKFRCLNWQDALTWCVLKTASRVFGVVGWPLSPQCCGVQPSSPKNYSQALARDDARVHARRSSRGQRRDFCHCCALKRIPNLDWPWLTRRSSILPAARNLSSWWWLYYFHR